MTFCDGPVSKGICEAQMGTWFAGFLLWTSTQLMTGHVWGQIRLVSDESAGT